MVDLSITIVSYNTLKLTGQCLESIYSNTEGISLAVTVVDNASSDGSAEYIREKFPQVNVICNAENLGLAAATNQGLALCESRYVMALNSDTVVGKGTLRRLVAFMDEHADAGGATPRLVLPDGGRHPDFWGGVPDFRSELSSALEPFRYTFGQDGGGKRQAANNDLEETREVPCILWGTAFMVRRETMDEVGLQDPRFFVYGEDIDWSIRISRAGWKLYYVADASVTHYGGRSTGQSSVRMFAQLYKSRCRFVQKHYGLPAGLALRLIIAFVCGIRLLKWAAVGLVRGKRDSKASERVDQMSSIIRAVLTG